MVSMNFIRTLYKQTGGCESCEGIFWTHERWFDVSKFKNENVIEIPSQKKHI